MDIDPRIIPLIIEEERAKKKLISDREQRIPLYDDMLWEEPKPAEEEKKAPRGVVVIDI